jgi:hypothetical protein
MSTVMIKIKGWRAAEHLPWEREPQFWLLIGSDTPAFAKTLSFLKRLSTASGWEGDLDRGDNWRTLREFLLYDGNDNATRRQLAKRVMLLLGMITSTEHFMSETC